MKGKDYAIIFLSIMLLICCVAFFIMFGVTYGPAIFQQFAVRPPSPTPAEIFEETPTESIELTPVISSTPITSIEQATATAKLSTPTVTATVTHTPRPKGTPVSPTPVGKFEYVPGKVVDDTSRGCTAYAIFGWVRDMQGRGLAGVSVKRYDDYGNVGTATTKSGIDLGYYDFILGADPDIWHIVIIDGAGNPISPPMDVPHMKDGSTACQHRLDWQRTH